MLIFYHVFYNMALALEILNICILLISLVKGGQVLTLLAQQVTVGPIIILSTDIVLNKDVDLDT